MSSLLGQSDSQRGVYAQVEQNLEENLVGPSPDTVLPTMSATPMIEVVAPATLQEDHKFDVELDGQSFSVQVPKGGIEEGQKFMVPMPTGAAPATPSRMQIPVGHWKDGLCNCCVYGICHNHIWTSLLCVPIAAGQVMSRLQLSWLGQPGSIQETTGAFQRLLFIVVSYISIFFLCNFIIGNYDEHPGDAPAFILGILIVRESLHYLYWGFGIFIIWRLRKYVRNKYAIPESENFPTGCEDVCCSVFCVHLTAAQLMRHTADYDTYHATCCTETGLPSHVPAIV